MKKWLHVYGMHMDWLWKRRDNFVDKHRFPDNPDGDRGKDDKDKKFDKRPDGSRRNKDDGSIWEKDKAGERAHGPPVSG